MSKAAANDLLSAYLDGELTDVERTEVKQQLQSDAELRSELETIKSAVAFLQTHGPVKAPPNFMAEVLSAVENEPMPQGGWWAWLRKPFGLPIEGLAVAVAAAAVLFIVWPTKEYEPNLEAATKPVAAQPSPTDPKGWSSSAQGQEEMLNPQNDNDGVAVVDLPDEVERQIAEKRKDNGKKELSEDSKLLQELTRSGDGNLTQTGQDFEQTYDLNTDNTANTAAPSWQSVPFMYSIRTQDPETLLRLHRLAGQHSGKVTDGKSRVKSTELPPGLSSFYVAMPALELNGFEAELFQLGDVQRYDNPNGELIYSEGEATLRIDMQLSEAIPQGTSAAPQGKPAAKRMMDAYDVDEKAQPAEALHRK
ncbi:MAG: hypothetical protein HN348_11560 [Proteobacteria bacterium]|jgi:negative regulator of sigma E activity|nr:hypothetical protein [Pseudomonadota bacterium]